MLRLSNTDGFLVVSSLIFMVAVLRGQIVPDAPVIDFKLPMFGENGYKIWELQGEEGRFVNPERIDVAGMTLKVFSGQADLKLETTIESPIASMYIEESRATGESALKITGPNYLVEGADWIWYGTTRTVYVKRAVRVIFDQKLIDILK